MQKIEENRLYKHYKGNVYKILCFAQHSETNQKLIIYQNVEHKDIWARPYEMWNEIVDNRGTLRFTLLE